MRKICISFKQFITIPIHQKNIFERILKVTVVTECNKNGRRTEGCVALNLDVMMSWSVILCLNIFTC